LSTEKKSKEPADNLLSQNKRLQDKEVRPHGSNHVEYDATAKIDELLRPCDAIKQSKNSCAPVDKCIVILNGRGVEGCRAYLNRSDLYIYGKCMNKAEFVDVLNTDDRLYVRIANHRQGYGFSTKGKHAINYYVTSAWIGKVPIIGKAKDGSMSYEPFGEDKKAFLDYLKDHKLSEEEFRKCYEGKQPKRPFFPLRRSQSNNCFVSSLVAPKGEGEGASCGIVEVADGPLAGMLWGFDQMCLYICGVRVYCNDLNRLFLTADRVGPKDATYLTVEATWKQSGEEANFWDNRVGSAIRNHPSCGPQRPECKMVANLIYFGSRPRAPKKFEQPPCVEDILGNKPLMQWLESQKMEPQFFHDLLQGVLPPIKQVLAYNNALFNGQKNSGTKPIPNQTSKGPTPLMSKRSVSPLTAATEHFLNSPSKKRGNWPDGWTDDQDRHKSRGRSNAFDRLGPPPKSRNSSPKSRRMSPVSRAEKKDRSPRKRNHSPEIIEVTNSSNSSKRQDARNQNNELSSTPKVNLSAGSSGSNSAHVTGTLHRVERIVNGVLQCVSHDDPKVDSIITDKSDLQMAMFISKTLTTAIIRFNTGVTLQKQNLPSLSMGSLTNANVGVVKPMNMGGFGGPGAYGVPNAGLSNNQKLENFQQAWNMGMGKGMEFGNAFGGTGDDMNGFRAAASAAGFQIR